MSLLSIALLLIGQTADAGVPLEASGKWAVDYGDRACTLSRSFASDGTSLELRREYLAREGATAILRIPEIHATTSRQFDATIIFADGEPMAVAVNSTSLPKQSARMVTMHLDQQKFARLISGELFALPVDRKTKLWFNAGNFDEAVKALSKCSDDLVQSLGIPVAELDAVVIYPTPAAKIDLSPRRFPTELSGKRYLAQSDVLIEITANGRVASCRVTAYSGPEVLRNAACDRSSETRFKPAKDHSSTPIRAWVVLKVTNTDHP